jgi:hypothetical protein
MSENTTTNTVASKKGGAASGLLFDAILIAIISFLVSVSVVKFGGPYFSAPAERKSIAVVNFEKLVQEYIMGLSEQVSTGAVPVGEMTAKSAAFTSELQQRLRVYADSGTTVLRSDVVIVAPDDLVDITDSLRSELVAAGFLPKEQAKTAQPPAR